MPTVQVLDAKGKQAGSLELKPDVFGSEIRVPLVHQAVTRELADRRVGTHDTKGRSEVSGGGRKPWKQKGTGRARQGSTRAVQWKGGGVAFAPRTNYDVKVNRKERRAAFRSALTDHAQAGTLAVVDGGAFSEPSTKSARGLLDAWGQDLPALVVVTADEEGLIKSFRNLERVLVTIPAELEVSELVWARSLIVSEAALPAVQEKGA